jgi:hypothetical protein
MKAPTIRVLLNEDVADDAELELRELKRANLRIASSILKKRLRRRCAASGPT